MCGIAGSIVRHGQADRTTVEHQLELLLHRGPDAIGAFVRGPAAIGQTRLSIIDLRTGDPPITSADGRAGVVLNGELYNYRELRDELLAAGHELRTKGDTEVLLHLAEEEGTRWVSRVEGMFAAAIWDERRGRLVLLRDRLGKKPLYWWRGPNAIVFASEIKAVLDHPAVTASLDPGAIPDFLHLGYVPSPRTFFHGIESVPPGTVVSIDLDLQVHVERYWSRPLHRTGTARHVSLRTATSETEALLRTAVRDRLVSDVPVGAFLSGGVDSSIVVGLMSEASDRPVPTFTMGFDDSDGFDERAPAAAMARHFGTEHHEFLVRPDAVALLDELVVHHDQPFGDSSAIPMWLLSRETAGEVTVALSGDGGDEVFAGYHRMTAGLLADRFGGIARHVRLDVLGRRLEGRGARGPKLARLAEALGHDMPTAYRELSAYAAATTVTRLAGSPTGAVSDYQAIWDGSVGASPLQRILDLNLRTYLLDDLLPKVDRMSMAHGLEVRSPFLDHRLVEHIAALPDALVHHRGKGKRLLREVARGLLPAEVLTRAKRGFGVPLTRWFREDLARDVQLRLGRGARIRTHVDGLVVDGIVADHIAGRADHRDLLWSLLTLETFLQRRGW